MILSASRYDSREGAAPMCTASSASLTWRGFLVGVGVHSDSLDAHLAGGSDDPTRNFATVRDQDFL